MQGRRRQVFHSLFLNRNRQSPCKHSHHGFSREADRPRIFCGLHFLQGQGGKNTIEGEALDAATHIATAHQQKDHGEKGSVRSHLDDELGTGSLKKWPLQSPECSCEDGLKIGRRNIRSRWDSKRKDRDVGTHWTCGRNSHKHRSHPNLKTQGSVVVT